MKTTIKSITAVFAGFLTVVVLSVATDAILEALGIFPPLSESLTDTWMLLLALTYRVIFTVLGGYVTALLAPRNKIKHVHILGLIGIIMGSIGTIIGWDLSQHWYPISLAVTAYPATWLGGLLLKNKN